MAQLKISKPVGDIAVNGTSPNANMFDDILIVQYLLNKSPGPGKPNPPLAENGTLSAEFFAAIRAYESSRGPVDGRIDPGDATMTALNGVPLGEFEGITDPLEQRSVIARNKFIGKWNFTRGDYKTLTVTNGSALSFDPSTTWLPDYFKTRILTLLNKILKPEETPAATWGVSTFDSHHWHLGCWSRANKPISQASQDWIKSAIGDPGPGGLVEELQNLRKPFRALNTSFPSDIAKYRVAHAAWLRTPGVAMVLNAYTNLQEAAITHHTFEGFSWRPFETSPTGVLTTMATADPRRHWMLDAQGAISKPPYMSAAELDAASLREEFKCEGMLQINLLIDKSGVIHPILGLPQDLSVVTGMTSDAMHPPMSIFDTSTAAS